MTEIHFELFISWQNLQNVIRQKSKTTDEKKNYYSILLFHVKNYVSNLNLFQKSKKNFKINVAQWFANEVTFMINKELNLIAKYIEKKANNDKKFGNNNVSFELLLTIPVNVFANWRQNWDINCNIELKNLMNNNNANFQAEKPFVLNNSRKCAIFEMNLETVIQKTLFYWNNVLKIYKSLDLNQCLKNKNF